MSGIKAFNKAGTIFAVLAIAITAVMVTNLAVRDSTKTGASTLPAKLVNTAKLMPMVSPVYPPRGVRAIVDQSGQCLWVLTRDGNERACQDEPQWKNLPVQIDKGQFFRGSSLD